MHVFVMLEFLRDEIDAFLHSYLPDPLGDVSYFVLITEYAQLSWPFFTYIRLSLSDRIIIYPV